MIDELKITTESGITLTILGNWAKQIEQAFLSSPEWFAEHGYTKVQPAISPQEGELVDINKILNQVWQGSKSKGTHEIPDGAEEALIVAQHLADKARMVSLPSEDELERMVEDSIEDRFQLDSTISSQINYAKLLRLLKEPR